MVRALVTGACGFAGRYLIEHLLAAGDEVLGTVLFNKSFDFAHQALNIEDPKATAKIVREFNPDVVYHLAGLAFVPEAEKSFDIALRVNVLGSYNVFQACHELEKNVKILYTSSAEVYGVVKPADLPLTEQSPLRPKNNYSLSKLMAETAADKFSRMGHVQTVVVRPFNHSGAGQNDRFVASNFARQLSRIALKKSEPILSVGNLTAKRDFSDVRDIVAAYRLAAMKGKGVYNVGSGTATSVQEVLNTLVEVSGVSVTIEQDETRMRPSEMPMIYGSCERAEKELGWVRQYSLRDTLESIYAFWYDQESKK